MKKITIVVSGSQEESLTKKLARGAAQLLAENWDAGCSLQVEEVPRKETVKPPAEAPGFMIPGFR